MKCVRDIKCPLSADCAVVGCILSNPLIIDEAEELKKQINGIAPKQRHKFIIDVLQEKQPPKVRKSHINRYFGMKFKGGIDMDKDEIPKKLRKRHTHTAHVPSPKPYSIINKGSVAAVKQRRKKTSSQIKLEKREQCVKAAHYVNYMGKDCPCVGFIDRAYSNSGLAGVKKYQNAYYHSGEQKYLFEVLDGILAYAKAKVEKFIKPFYPDAKNVSLSVSANSIIEGTDKIDKEYILFLQSQTPEQFMLAQKFGWKLAQRFTAPAENFHYL